jgi:hypothetical protein
MPSPWGDGFKGPNTVRTSSQAGQQSLSLILNDGPGKTECGFIQSPEKNAVARVANAGIQIVGSTSAASMNLCPSCLSFCLYFIRILNGKRPAEGLAYRHYAHLAGLEMSVDTYGCRICFLLLQILHDCGSKFSFLRHVGTGSEQGALMLSLNEYSSLPDIDPSFDTWGLELLHFGNQPSASPIISLIPLVSLGMSPHVAKNELFRLLILC